MVGASGVGPSLTRRSLFCGRLMQVDIREGQICFINYVKYFKILRSSTLQQNPLDHQPATKQTPFCQGQRGGVFPTCLVWSVAYALSLKSRGPPRWGISLLRHKMLVVHSCWNNFLDSFFRIAYSEFGAEIDSMVPGTMSGQSVRS